MPFINPAPNNFIIVVDSLWPLFCFSFDFFFLLFGDFGANGRTLCLDEINGHLAECDMHVPIVTETNSIKQCVSRSWANWMRAPAGHLRAISSRTLFTHKKRRTALNENNSRWRRRLLNESAYGDAPSLTNELDDNQQKWRRWRRKRNHCTLMLLQKKTQRRRDLFIYERPLDNSELKRVEPLFIYVSFYGTKYTHIHRHKRNSIQFSY